MATMLNRSNHIPTCALCNLVKKGKSDGDDFYTNHVNNHHAAGLI